MTDLPQILLIVGGAGWFLLTYTLLLGKNGPLEALWWTVFNCFILIDVLAIFLGTVWPTMRQQMIGARPICLFVLLPYVLSGIRISWLVTRVRRDR